MKLLTRFLGSNKTKFPTLEIVSDDGVPELDETSVSSLSDDDSEIVESSKVDEDVKVWCDLMQRMPREQQIFLLQNHLRTQLGIVLPPRIKKSVPATAVIPKIKKFRFAEITGGAVRTERRMIDLIPADQQDDCWWSPEEAYEIRRNNVRMVKYCRSRRPDIGAALAILAENENSSVDTEKRIVDCSFSRGLESHLVPTLSSLRKRVVKTVLEEQKACNGLLTYDEAAERIRNTSLSISEPSRRLARKLAECDHVEALTASLSKWTVAYPGFF
jgi:hypothetical protein